MYEWVNRSLRDLIGSPVSGSRPSGGAREDTEGVPSLGGENVLAEGGTTYRVLKRIPRPFFASMGKGQLQDGDVLINKDGAQTGKVGLYRGEFDEAAVNEHLFILRSKDGSIDQRLLYYCLLRRGTQDAIARVITGSAQPGLNSSFVDHVRIALPMEPLEQRRIAQVLLTLDTAIQETDAIIAKLKAVKQGLLHDLLTRGIDTNGELRPLQSEAPHLYQQSSLGWIPQEWQTTTLGKFAHLQRGFDIVEDELKPGPYPVVSSSGVIGYHNVKTAQGPNVVVGRKGSIGTVHYIESDFWAHDTSLFVTNFYGNHERFVSHVFGYLRLGQYGTKSGSPSLNRNDVHPLWIGRPNFEEQLRIVARMDTHQSVLVENERQLGKLRQLKVALMDDLLTGRVRVTSLLD